MERQLSYRPLAVVEIVETICYFVWAIVTVSVGWGVWGLASASLVRALTGTAVCWLVLPSARLIPSLSWARVKPLLGFGFRYQAVGIATFLRDQGTNAAIAVFAGVSALGVWSVALRILQIPLLLITSLWRISYPGMSRLVAAKEDVGPTIERVVALTASRRPHPGSACRRNACLGAGSSRQSMDGRGGSHSAREPSPDDRRTALGGSDRLSLGRWRCFGRAPRHARRASSHGDCHDPAVDDDRGICGRFRLVGVWRRRRNCARPERAQTCGVQNQARSRPADDLRGCGSCGGLAGQLSSRYNCPWRAVGGLLAAAVYLLALWIWHRRPTARRSSARSTRPAAGFRLVAPRRCGSQTQAVSQEKSPCGIDRNSREH